MSYHRVRIRDHHLRCFLMLRIHQWLELLERQMVEPEQEQQQQMVELRLLRLEGLQLQLRAVSQSVRMPFQSQSFRMPNRPQRGLREPQEPQKVLKGLLRHPMNLKSFLLNRISVPWAALE